MVSFEQHVSVFLKFRAMTAPVAVSVPGYVLRYLDTHAERAFAEDGTVIYVLPPLAGATLEQAARAASATVLAA